MAADAAWGEDVEYPHLQSASEKAYLTLLSGPLEYGTD